MHLAARPPPAAIAMHSRFEVSDVGGDSSSSGGSSPASVSGPSDSDGSSSSTADEFPDARQLRRRIAPLPSTSGSVPAGVEHGSFHPISPTSLSVLSDIDRHMQSMALLLPAFASSAAAPRAQALARWLGGFDVRWVLEMDAAGSCGSQLPRREVGRRVRVWALALSTMDRVFRLRHREARNPVNDAAAAQLTALGELASASAGAMLKLTTAVAALGSSPSTLLAALDVYVPVSEAYPGLARMFSWCAAASHPVPAAADAALAALLDAARRCVRDLPASIRAHYPWRMPQGGELHPCVGFWMGYFHCMLRNRVSLYLVLAGGGGDGDGEEATTPAVASGGEGGVVADLISCLEAVLKEKSGELAFPGLRHVFMLNNTHAIVRSDLAMFLPLGWARAREERMERYVKRYLDVSWAPVVSRVAGAGAAKPAAVSVLRRRRDPLTAFYSALENACSTQRCWKVPSPVLRRVLRRTVSEHAVPAYRRYLEQVELPAPARTVEDLDRQLSELFEG